MFKKIITGARTGAERAVLDAALKFGIPYGGWIPRGRIAKDGPLPDGYKLQELSTTDFDVCAKMNIIDSQGTVAITNGDFKNGFELAKKCAHQFDRKWLHINLNKISANLAASKIHDWMVLHEIEILHITGSGINQYPDIYSKSLVIMNGLAKHILQIHKRTVTGEIVQKGKGGYGHIAL